MSNLWQDLRYGMRMLSRKPGLTIVAVLTLALGIGANTSIFSLINAVLLRPLPFAEPDRLIVVHERNAEGNQNTVGGHEFAAWRAQNHALERLALYGYSSFNLTGGGEPELLNAMHVSADFFAVLRERPLAGRLIGTGDDETGAPRIVVLSHQLWQRRFASDPGMVGRSISLSDVPYTVVGVAPRRGEVFDPDVWVPMDVPGEIQKVGRHGSFVMGRLRPGISVADARSDLARIAQRLEQEMPADNTGHGVIVRSMHEDVVGNVRRPLIVFMGAAAFILLIACANVAHLLLTRAAARDKELAIRTALGAGRGRLIRQLLTESLLLGLAGGTAGLLIAAWVIDLLPSLSAVQLPRLDELSIDRRVLGITVALSLLTGIISGVMPAMQSTRLRSMLRLWLTEGSKVTSGPGRRMAGALIISEVALALVLLVGAGLTIKSFARLMAVDAGFNPRNVLTVPLDLPATRYADAHRVRAAYDQLYDRLRSVPGVQIVGASAQVPTGQCCMGLGFTIEGRPEPLPGRGPGALLNIVSNDFFRALQIPLRNGRYFNTGDARLALPLIRWWPGQTHPTNFETSQAPPVVIINEAMAQQFWPGENPVGKRMRVLFSPWATVVGVVGNVRQRTLGQPAEPEMYLPHTQEPWGGLTLVLRTAGDPQLLAGAVRDRIRAFDRDLPTGQIQSLEQVVWNSVRSPRFNALLLGIAGSVALLLALIGIYGVMSYSVARRTHEIGIRTALGASSSEVLKLILTQAMTLAGAGIALGLLGALALSRVLHRMLFEVEPTDPLTFVLIAVLLAAVCLLACYLPTRRAMRVDPMIALRSE
ncbi:MAG: ABC transporter permease [Longimicrobiales bacterium]